MTCATALCLIGTLAAVVDGDTLRHPPGPNIRLHGIDAPERNDSGGPAATRALAGLIDGQMLACEPMDVDRYGRIVARCLLPDGTDLACAMVAAGHARDWPKYSAGRYRECER